MMVNRIALLLNYKELPKRMYTTYHDSSNFKFMKSIKIIIKKENQTQ